MWKYSKKLENYQKMINLQQIKQFFYFDTVYLFLRNYDKTFGWYFLSLMSSHIVSEHLLNESKKWYHTEKDEKVTYKQHATKWFKAFAFFSDSYIWRKPI